MQKLLLIRILTGMKKQEQEAVKATYLSIFGNVLLALVKGITGYFGNSYALIADAIESTSDIFSSVLVLIGIKYSSKPADKNHPYGHGRAEPLFTFIVVALLTLSAIVIAYQSIQNILTPHATPESYTLIVLGIIIIIKEIFYRVMLVKSKLTNSTVLKADAWHHRSDAITSLTAFIGIAIALMLGKGYESADDWAALFASGFILYNAYFIFRTTLGEIMDEHLYDDLEKEIRKISQTVNGIIDTEKCLIRKNGMRFFIDLHATVNANITVSAGHEIAHRLKDRLMQELPQIADVLVHVEPHI